MCCGKGRTQKDFEYGDQFKAAAVKLSEAGFALLAKAFFAEIEKEYS